MKQKTYKVSEIFPSFQGEGIYSGQLTIFIRFFGCNLNCDFFGQPLGTDIDKRETWVRPYETIDISQIKTLKELPVFSIGCDSSYSWSSRYKHLSKFMSANEIKEEVIKLAKENYNIDLFKEWTNSSRGHSSQIQLCFTGGEPMLQQDAITEICREFVYDENNFSGIIPRITIETNATIKRKDLHIRGKVSEIHLSMSPKLYYVSGEKDKVNIDVINQYLEYTDTSAIKFVLNNDDRAWEELDYYLPKIRELIGCHNDCSLFVMPCNSRAEDLQPEYVESIVRKAMSRCLHISMRSHIFAFSNSIGT